MMHPLPLPSGLLTSVLFARRDNGVTGARSCTEITTQFNIRSEAVACVFLACVVCARVRVRVCVRVRVYLYPVHSLS